MRSTGDSWARRSGVLLGLIAAAVFLLAFPVKGGGGAMGLDVTITSMPTGELAIDPVGPFVQGAGLAPDDEPATGKLEIRNQTGVSLAVGINILVSSNYSDEFLEVTATNDGILLFKGTVGELRGLQDDLLQLDSGETASVDVKARVLDGAVGYQGRIETVSFELHSEAL
jgi:hypothetical protein